MWPSQIATQSSVATCNFRDTLVSSDKDKLSRDSDPQFPSSEEMKTNDLKPSLNFLSETDLSDLPFSMPKLHRKLAGPGSGGLGLPPPPRPRHSRPVSLHASTPSHAALSTLKLPLQGNQTFYVYL